MSADPLCAVDRACIQCHHHNEADGRILLPRRLKSESEELKAATEENQSKVLWNEMDTNRTGTLNIEQVKSLLLKMNHISASLPQEGPLGLRYVSERFPVRLYTVYI